MNRAEKKAVTQELSANLVKSRLMVVTHYHGLTVSDVTSLRVSARKSGVGIQVAKNTLAKLALRNGHFSVAENLFKGPTAIAYSEDPIAAAKVVAEFAKGNEKLLILGGAMDGKSLSPDQIKELATLPSLDELRGKLIGLIQAPATKVAGVIQASPAKLARVFNAYASVGN